MNEYAKTIGYSRCVNIGQLRNVLDTFKSARTFETLRDGQVAVAVTLATRGDEQLLLLGLDPLHPDDDHKVERADGSHLRSEDGTCYRYICHGGPLHGAWIELPVKVPGDYHLRGVDSGKYQLADAGLLQWIIARGE